NIFLLNPTHPTHIEPLSLHDALPISYSRPGLHSQNCAGRHQLARRKSTSHRISNTHSTGSRTERHRHIQYRVSASPRLNIIDARDRKSTRLNSSHLGISYAVFCLKKK